MVESYKIFGASGTGLCRGLVSVTAFLGSSLKPSAAVIKASNHFGAMVSNVPADPIVATNGVRAIVVGRHSGGPPEGASAMGHGLKGSD